MPSIRRATPNDLDGVLPLVREFYTVDKHPNEERRDGLALAPLLADDAVGQVWLLTTDGPDELVGYAIVTWSMRPADMAPAAALAAAVR